MAERNTGGANERLHLLDGLRGIAAIGVLLFHVPGFFPVPEFMQRGYLFVDLFFLLSGFVLTPVIAERNARRMGTGDFLKARFRRFFPLMALGAFLAAILFSLDSRAELVPLKLALAFAFIPAFLIAEAVFPLNVVQWSLFWELLANGAHARAWDRWKDKALVAMVFLAGLAHGAAIVIHETGDLGAHADTFLLAAPRIIFSYGAGMLMARHFRGPRDADWTAWVLRLALPVLAVSLLPLTGSAVACFEAAVVLLVFPVSFWLVAHCRPAQQWNGVLNWLGRISFPLYAVHIPVLIATQLSLISHFGENTWSGAIIGPALALSVSAALAWIMEPRTGWRRARAPKVDASPA
ncbi:acyltransferase family protein [Aurantiacibacter poecillastricola]|uniref:acyltransferase family protein n=1 Tax=Aurantiacibacter poecillastricola TaxID=3064385 RepID=UPI00273F0C06|nr:acyltransferase [Aurantiacibacter sp. 219JJ12-13]MDP5262201.1 acyltransferase [Aurantiacibacter sp. 219JJ12-13]